MRVLRVRGILLEIYLFLEVQTKYAKKVSDALSAISDGNQKSIYACDMMIEVINDTMHYQKNNLGKRGFFCVFLHLI